MLQRYKIVFLNENIGLKRYQARCILHNFASRMAPTRRGNPNDEYADTYVCPAMDIGNKHDCRYQFLLYPEMVATGK